MSATLSPEAIPASAIPDDVAQDARDVAVWHLSQEALGYRDIHGDLADSLTMVGVAIAGMRDTARLIAALERRLTPESEYNRLTLDREVLRRVAERISEQYNDLAHDSVIVRQAREGDDEAIRMRAHYLSRAEPAGRVLDWLKAS